MRTTIDMPDALMQRVKTVAAGAKDDLSRIGCGCIGTITGSAPKTSGLKMPQSESLPERLNGLKAMPLTTQSMHNAIVRLFHDRTGYQHSGTCPPKEASLHEPARQTVKDLAESISPWCICFHDLIEFWNCHPSKILAQSLQPGRGLSTDPRVARGSQLAYTRRLGHSTGITGIDHNHNFRKIHVLVHDARITACCLANGVTEIWTVDRDFSRFPDLKTRNHLDRITVQKVIEPDMAEKLTQ